MTTSNDNPKPPVSGGRTIQYQAPYWDGYLPPHGYLNKEIACHALWYYYVLAMKNYEEIEKDPIVYEGEKDPEFNNFQLFKGVAQMYGVAPERMLRFWINIDIQANALGFRKLPEKYRFTKIAEVRTQ